MTALACTGAHARPHVHETSFQVNLGSQGFWRIAVQERMWLRGRVSVLLSEGRGLDSPGLHVEVSLNYECVCELL